jgi:hypothetical protein
MPIRIKPVHDLQPCQLDLESIKGLCDLVEQHFNDARFSAEEGVWEVYDARRDELISAISPRETLDSFTVNASNNEAIHSGPNAVLFLEKEIKILFSRYQATVKFSGPHDLESWFEHFMIDLKKCLRPPRLRQRVLAERGEGDYEPLGIAVVSSSAVSWIIKLGLKASSTRYCHIVLHKRPPSPFIENVKANLVSNLIWVVIVFVAGIAFAFLTLWLYKKYGVNINEWLSPPSITAPAPTP